MCDFEEMDLRSPYGRNHTADDDGLLEVLRSGRKWVLATAHIAEDLGLTELLAIWEEFCLWSETVKPILPEEEQCFSTGANGKKVWVIDNGGYYTIMYPEDY